MKYIILIILFTPLWASAQLSADSIFAKAFAKLSPTSMAIEFGQVGYSLKTPEEVFVKENPKVYKGGHIYVEGDKFEMQTGLYQSISDGKKMLFINQRDRVMIVDSIRKDSTTMAEYAQGMQLFYEQRYTSDTSLFLLRSRMIMGDQCYVLEVRSQVDGQPSFSRFYIRQKDFQLRLMAEWSMQDNYTVYVVKSIGAAPKNYSYVFSFPAERQEELMGFKVFDFRYLDITK